MITIFTPTYNRAYILHNLYKSLQKQTFKDFEWIVVDDGSTDNTDELFNQWLCENNYFNIFYIKQKNGGKHRAINKGVTLAKGELFFIVDSDDYISETALEKINENFINIKENKNFAGLCGMKAYFNNDRVGGEVSFKQIDCSMIDIREKYKIKGDVAEVFRTDILKLYPFPEFEGENFLSEGVIYIQIAKKYIFRYFNEKIYFCEYLSDGLTKNIAKKYRKNPLGTMLLLMLVINDSSRSRKIKIKSAIKYWRAVPFYGKAKEKEMKPKLWMYLFWIFGFIIYMYDLILEFSIYKKKRGF